MGIAKGRKIVQGCFGNSHSMRLYLARKTQNVHTLSSSTPTTMPTPISCIPPSPYQSSLHPLTPSPLPPYPPSTTLSPPLTPPSGPYSLHPGTQLSSPLSSFLACSAMVSTPFRSFMPLGPAWFLLFEPEGVVCCCCWPDEFWPWESSAIEDWPQLGGEGGRLVGGCDVG